MDVSEKYVEKNACSRCFWQKKMKSWLDKETDQNTSAKSLALLCGEVGIVWSLSPLDVLTH